MRGRLVLTAGVASCGLAAFVATAAVARVSEPQARTHTPAQKRAAAERGVPFAAGETLEYDVSWSSYLTASTATLSVRAKKPSYDSVAYVVAEGQATGLVAALCPGILQGRHAARRLHAAASARLDLQPGRTAQETAGDALRPVEKNGSIRGDTRWTPEVGGAARTDIRRALGRARDADAVVEGRPVGHMARL